MRVLVVDDSKFNRSRVVAAIAGDQYEIQEAVDGQDALDRLATFPADVICTDLLMPRLDGFGLMQELRNRRLTTPVIVLSADIQASSRDTCRDLGAVAFLNKPVAAEALRAAIEQAVSVGTAVTP